MSDKGGGGRRPRRKFTQEFKDEAVRLVDEAGGQRHEGRSGAEHGPVDPAELGRAENGRRRPGPRQRRSGPRSGS